MILHDVIIQAKAGSLTGSRTAEELWQESHITFTGHCYALKPKGSICLLVKLADTAFWLCTAVFVGLWPGYPNQNTQINNHDNRARSDFTLTSIHIGLIEVAIGAVYSPRRLFLSCGDESHPFFTVGIHIIDVPQGTGLSIPRGDLHFLGPAVMNMIHVLSWSGHIISVYRDMHPMLISR